MRPAANPESRRRRSQGRTGPRRGRREVRWLWSGENLFRHPRPGRAWSAGDGSSVERRDRRQPSASTPSM